MFDGIWMIINHSTSTSTLHLSHSVVLSLPLYVILNSTTPRLVPDSSWPVPTHAMPRHQSYVATKPFTATQSRPAPCALPSPPPSPSTWPADNMQTWTSLARSFYDILVLSGVCIVPQSPSLIIPVLIYWCLRSCLKLEGSALTLLWSI